MYKSYELFKLWDTHGDRPVPVSRTELDYLLNGAGHNAAGQTDVTPAARLV